MHSPQRQPGDHLRPEDVWVNLVEVAMENWSFGNGDASYAREPSVEKRVAA